MSAYTAVFDLRCVCLRLTNVYGPAMQAKDSIVARSDARHPAAQRV